MAIHPVVGRPGTSGSRWGKPWRHCRNMPKKAILQRIDAARLRLTPQLEQVLSPIEVRIEQHLGGVGAGQGVEVAERSRARRDHSARLHEDERRHEQRRHLSPSPLPRSQHIVRRAGHRHGKQGQQHEHMSDSQVHVAPQRHQQDAERRQRDGERAPLSGARPGEPRKARAGAARAAAAAFSPAARSDKTRRSRGRRLCPSR